jgi:hypothetical protein
MTLIEHDPGEHMRCSFFGASPLPHYLYQLYKWLLFIPFLGASTLILGITAAGLATTLGPSIGTWIGVIWARLHSYLTPMFVSVSGREHVR